MSRGCGDYYNTSLGIVCEPQNRYLIVQNEQFKLAISRAEIHNSRVTVRRQHTFKSGTTRILFYFEHIIVEIYVSVR